MRIVLILALCIAPEAAAAGPEFGTVHIYRDSGFVGAGIVPRVFADGKPLVDIEEGRYYAGQFPPGRHVFHLDDKRRGVELDLESGKSYYLRIEIVPGVMAGSGRVTMVMPEQGSYEAKALREVDRAMIRNKEISLGYAPARLAMIVQEDLTRVAKQLLARGGRSFLERWTGNSPSR